MWARYPCTDGTDKLTPAGGTPPRGRTDTSAFTQVCVVCVDGGHGSRAARAIAAVEAAVRFTTHRQRDRGRRGAECVRRSVEGDERWLLFIETCG